MKNVYQDLGLSPSVQENISSRSGILLLGGISKSGGPKGSNLALGGTDPLKSQSLMSLMS